MIIRVIVNSFILSGALYLLMDESDRYPRILYALLALLPLIYGLKKLTPPYKDTGKLLGTCGWMLLVLVTHPFVLLAFNSLASIALELQRKYPPKMAPDISLSNLLIIYNLFVMLLIGFLLFLFFGYGDTGFGFLLDDPYSE